MATWKEKRDPMFQRQKEIDALRKRHTPTEIEMERLERLGASISIYQEFSGYCGPRYWKVTLPSGECVFACSMRRLREIANELQRRHPTITKAEEP